MPCLTETHSTVSSRPRETTRIKRGSSSNDPILVPQSPERRDLASHTRVGVQEMTRASSKHNQQSTSYRPRLNQSALFSTATTSNSDSETRGQHVGQKRDDRLALCEMDPQELENRRGPRQFHAPQDDEDWSRVDPNSAIRFKCRLLPHSSVQGILTGRLHLPPSMLYSIVRPQFHNPSMRFNERGSGGGGSDLLVPVSGDWVTIGVLVEKSPIRVAYGATDLIEEQDGDHEDEDLVAGSESDRDSSDCQIKQEQKREGRVRPRKFISFKFVDLGHGSYSSSSNSITSSVSSARNSLKGDSILKLMLFEASRSSKGTTDGLGKRQGISETVYTGGSGGAFEKWAKETEGAVVAIVNPRIMALQKDKASVGQVLTMNPTSANSMHLLGRSLDYAQCQAMTRNGTRCGNFADRRTSNGVCEWHVQKALEKNRSKGGRGEFSNSTGPVTALGNPSESGSRKGENLMAHFKKVKLEKADFGTSIKIKQEADTKKKGPTSFGHFRGMEGMQAPKAYHVEHASSRNFNPNDPHSFVAGLGEASLPRSHIKASNPQSLMFDATERFGRGRAEKEERARQRAKNEQLLLRLLEKKAAGEEDDDLLREEKRLRGDVGQDEEEGMDGTSNRRERESQDQDQIREYDDDGAEIIRKRKKIISSSDINGNSSRPDEKRMDEDQSATFMADSTQAITSGGKAIREAQLEIKKRKEKAEKMRLDKLKEKEDRKKGIKGKKASYHDGNSNPFARNLDASFDRDLNTVLTSRTVTNEVYEKSYNDHDDIIMPSDLKRIKRRKRESTPPDANVRKGGNVRNQGKRSRKEKESEAQKLARLRAKGIAAVQHDSGSDLESDSDQDNFSDDSINEVFEKPKRKSQSRQSNTSSAIPSISRVSENVRRKDSIGALRSSSQESEGNNETIEVNRTVDKGKGRAREVDSTIAARPAIPGPEALTDDMVTESDSGSDVEMHDDDRDSSRRDRDSLSASFPTSAQKISGSSIQQVRVGPPPPKTFAHSVDAVKKMGFDPLAGARGFNRRRLEAEQGPTVTGGSDVKSRLLARLSASTKSLPTPVLNSSSSKSRSNLSSLALASSKEAKERRLKAQFSRNKAKAKETRVGSDSEESGADELLRDPLLDLDLNLESRKRKQELDEDGLEIDEDDDWNSELEEEMQKAERAKTKKKLFVVASDEEQDAGSDLEIY